MDIPILIICFNNYKYVDNTIKQILNTNKDYGKNIRIVNNSSTCQDTIKYLENLPYKVYHNSNNGPWIYDYVNSHIYNDMPDKYIVTDPDLQFNKNLPSNFIEILEDLSYKYESFKVGFALDIEDSDKMYDGIYYIYNNEECNIYRWEKQFWKEKLNDNRYELYNSDIDTTFSLINKKFLDRNNYYKGIRIAGDFTAKHLPWYINDDIYSLRDRYILYNRKISTISRLIDSHINNNYTIINKSNEVFLIENRKNDINLPFWVNTYKNWEKETFDIFDQTLDKNKIFIDIGAWIGTTSIYGLIKSKHVYSIEADKKSFEDLTHNLKTNFTEGYTIINNAIYNINNIDIKFGKNKFLKGSKTNDSTSQIYTDKIEDKEDNKEDKEECYIVKTITIDSIIETNNINPSEISLIKVDIEGGEEYIMDDLYRVHKTYNIPLYLSFHYSWWNNKDLNRFEFLTTNQKQSIINDPFISIFFT